MKHLHFYFREKKTIVVGVIFALNAIILGNWVVRIPDVKDHIGFTEADLGFALLGAPLGALVVLPIAGWILSRINTGRSIIISSLLYALSPVALAGANSFWMLAAAMVYFGFTNAVMDVSMNSAAALMEREFKRPVMSTCHGMWSLGAMVGSVGGAALLSMGMPVFEHLSLIAILVLLVFAVLSPRILAWYEDFTKGQQIFAVPNKVLLLLALIAFCIMLSEGAIADWSALYMKDTLNSSALLVGMSYGAYSLFMAGGRFYGDAIIPKIGKKKVVIWGGMISAISLGATLVLADPYLAIIGFGITGIGFSCVIPVLFSSAANEPGYSHGAGIAAVTSIGYFGFLAGPPAIGFVAEEVSLEFALFIVVILSLTVAFLGWKVPFR